MRRHCFRLALLSMLMGAALAGAMLLLGCTSAQLQSAQADLQTSQQVLRATTQATTAAENALASAPTTGPAHDSAVSALNTAENAQNIAAQALNVAQATLTAIQTHNVDSPQTVAAVSSAASAIPAPWGLIAVAATPFVLGLIQMFINNKQATTAQNTLASALAAKDTAQSDQLSQVVATHAATVNQAVEALKVSAPVTAANATASATPTTPQK